MAAVVDATKQTFREFGRDEAMMRAAGVAFYSALSLAPMVLLFVAITGFFGESANQRMIQTINTTVGERAGQAVETIAAGGGERLDKSGLSLAISIVVILFSASGVMAALQTGLNRVWNVKVVPEKAFWKAWVRKRLLSMGMVLAIGFLLLVSTVATTVLHMLVPTDGTTWSLVSLAVSLAVFMLLFAAIYKVLPDVHIAWKDVWLGAAVTATLFAIGKFLIGLYIGRAGYADSYGAAGSVIAVLVWVYYSAVILFLGAELTQVIARRRGHEIRPNSHAVRVDAVAPTNPQNKAG